MEIKVKAKKSKDKKYAKILGLVLESMYDKYKPVVDQIIVTRTAIESLYGIQTEDYLWEKIMTSVIELKELAKAGDS